MTEKIFHIMVGTKGQLIKMAPIMLEMDKRGIEYNFINAGQHTKILYDIIDVFELKQPDVVLNKLNKDVANVKEMFFWIVRTTLNSLAQKKMPRKGDICLIHGDPIPALLCSIIAKINRAKIVHIESGERTHNLLNPFPEEISRRIIDRLSDFLFASSEESYQNLITSKVKGNVYNLRYNTVIDAIRFAIAKSKTLDFTSEKDYVLINIHRVENIYSNERLNIILSTIEKISKTDEVKIIMHEPFKNKLSKLNKLDVLSKNKNIEMLPLQDYVTIINLIQNSKYIVNDGGSPQLESYFLNTPCLLMRGWMEQTGYPNVCLSKYDETVIDNFIDNYKDYTSDANIMKISSPSNRIIDILMGEN